MVNAANIIINDRVTLCLTTTVKNKLTNGKISYFVTNNELSGPNENIYLIKVITRT